MSEERIKLDVEVKGDSGGGSGRRSGFGIDDDEGKRNRSAAEAIRKAKIAQGFPLTREEMLAEGMQPPPQFRVKPPPRQNPRGPTPPPPPGLPPEEKTFQEIVAEVFGRSNALTTPGLARAAGRSLGTGLGSGLGKFGGLIGGAAGGVLGGLAFGFVMGGFLRAVKSATNALEELAESGAKFNGGIARAFAIQQRERIFNEQRRANRLSNELVPLIGARTDLERAMNDIHTTLLEIFIPMLTPFVQGAASALETIASIMEFFRSSPRVKEALQRRENQWIEDMVTNKAFSQFIDSDPRFRFTIGLWRDWLLSQLRGDDGGDELEEFIDKFLNPMTFKPPEF